MPKKKRTAHARANPRVLRFAAALGLLAMLGLVFTDFGAGTEAKAPTDVPVESRPTAAVDAPRDGSQDSIETPLPAIEDPVAATGDLQLDLPGTRNALPTPSLADAARDLTFGPRVQSPPAAPAVPAQPAPQSTTVDRLRVDVSAQELELFAGVTLVRRYPVSTAKNGVGSARGSQRTPLGRHRIHSKFGAGEPLGMVFERRRPTGRVAPIFTDRTDRAEDVITTRILWLEGLEDNINRGGEVDSHSRYIYIHGTNEEGLIGAPASHGCVRMKNRDVLELYDLVAVGTSVEIVE